MDKKTWIFGNSRESFSKLFTMLKFSENLRKLINCSIMPLTKKAKIKKNTQKTRVLTQGRFAYLAFLRPLWKTNRAIFLVEKIHTSNFCCKNWICWRHLGNLASVCRSALTTSHACAVFIPNCLCHKGPGCTAVSFLRGTTSLTYQHSCTQIQ